MTEISLKRQARRFAEEHGVSYTRALAAVDEPLHRLKFELMTARHRRPGFLLTDSEDELLDPIAPEHAESPFALFTRKIRGTEVKPHVHRGNEPGEVILEMARRTLILQASGAAHIWDHRMLYRAGLTPENLEPLAYYYQHFRDVQNLLLIGNGAALGFVEVAVLQEAQREMRSEGIKLRYGQSGSLRLKKITYADFLDLIDPTGTRSAALRAQIEAEQIDHPEASELKARLAVAEVRYSEELTPHLEEFKRMLTVSGFPVLSRRDERLLLLVDASADPGYSVLMAASQVAEELGFDPESAIEGTVLKDASWSGLRDASSSELYRCSRCGKEDIYENMVEHPYYGHGDSVER